MFSFLKRLPILVGVLGTLGSPALVLSAPVAQAQAPAATQFQLPDGNLCSWQAPSQAQQLNGQLVTYVCANNNEVILGSPTLQNGTYTITTATLNPATNAVSDPTTLTVDITHVDLVDGTGCDFAGKGGGAGVNGQRINYTCGQGTNPQVALIGDFNTSAPLWTATRVQFTGSPGNFVVQNQDQPAITHAVAETATPTPGGALGPNTATQFQLPDGSLCTWQTPSQSQQVNGQLVTYTCNTNNQVILNAPTFQNGTYSITTATMNSGVVSNPTTLTVDITHVDLVDGAGCDFAGKGGGAAVNGQRINYTCGQGTNPQVALIGDFNTSAPLWAATRVRFTGTPGNFVDQNQDQPGINKAVTQTATPTPGGAGGPSAATQFVLPDGNVCTWQAPSQAQQLNGQPVTYICSANNEVILGSPTLQNGTYTITTATMNPTTTVVANPTTLTVDITHVNLADGMVCDFAGKGGGAGVNGQRINYTCGQNTNPQTALIGDFNTSQPLWTATRVTFTGTPGNFVVQNQDQPAINKATTQTATPTPGQITPTPVPTTQPSTAPTMTHDTRYFSETKFRIDNDAFYNFFTSRGGTDTFGFPVSRQFGFLGCQVQIFQRSVMQQCQTNGPVALLNLLDPEIFPYNKVNGSTFPTADDSIKARTPVPGSPGYDQAIITFVQQTAPDQFNGQPVDFNQTFNSTGGLEIWGAPISNPAPDPANANFIYQRFQRGIMHYTAGQGTRGILLADYLKAIILGPTQAQAKGANLPADLNQQAQGSSQYAQYCPGNQLWLCRPEQMPGTDLTYAFEVG